MNDIIITAQVRKRLGNSTMTPPHEANLRIRPHFPGFVELKQSRTQILLTPDQAHAVADALCDTAEGIDAGICTQWDSRPTYSTGDPL